MTDVYDFINGDSPLLVSIPHDGRNLAPGMAERMTLIGRDIPDTDWHVRQLYDFVNESGANVIAANYSRYVVDLNRSASDQALYPGQLATGLCPLKSFDGDDLYLPGAEPDGSERAARVDAFWNPYHDKIAAEMDRLRDAYGYALLWDAHSIKAEVPLLFDGALPDLNLGTFDGASCAPALEQAVAAVADASNFTSVVNGRFKGGHITRHYGKPSQSTHAIQLELAQRCYMRESSRKFDEQAADVLRDTLENMLASFLIQAERL